MTWASLIGPSASAASKAATSSPSSSSGTGTSSTPSRCSIKQRAVVGRLLDHDPVAGLEQVLEEHPAGLQRPVGDHHLRRRRAPRAARRSTRRARDARSRSRRRAPFPSPRQAQPRPPPRTASRGRMSALGAPRAKEIVSPAIAATLATPTPSPIRPPKSRGVSDLSHAQMAESSDRRLRREIVALAARQHGVVTRAAAGRSGAASQRGRLSAASRAGAFGSCTVRSSLSGIWRLSQQGTMARGSPRLRRRGAAEPSQRRGALGHL